MDKKTYIYMLSSYVLGRMKGNYFLKAKISTENIILENSFISLRVHI